MKFIIFSDTRCGSNLIKNLLNQQNNVWCHPEIFLIRNLNDIITVDNTPQKIISNLHTKKLFTGFKLTFSQALALEKKYNFSIEEYIKDKNLKVIFPERKNKFLKNLSLQKACITKHFCITETNKQLLNSTNIKFNFDVEKYYYETDKREAIHKKYSTYFEQNNISFLQVYYEDLIENKFNIQKEYEFITEFKERYKNVTPTILKQNIYTLEEQLLNYNEVKLALKDDFWFQTTIKEKNI